MNEVHLSSFEDFFTNFASPYTTDEMCFRGVPNSSFELIPSIGRIPQLIGDEQYLRDFELRVMDEFKMRVTPLLTNTPKSEWEWLFLAQHYGIKTRLLDWSTNPLIALYFAVSEFEDNDFAIYQGSFLDRLYLGANGDIQDFDLNGNKIITDPYSLTQNFVVYPSHLDNRLKNQSAFFTVSAKPDQPLRKDITKYVFPAALKSRFKSMLDAFGITRSFIYPTVDVLAEEIMNKWELELPM